MNHTPHGTDSAVADASNPRPYFGRLLRKQLARLIVRQANRARDGANWTKAATLYKRAYFLAPDRQDLAVQAGNCCKEAGHFDQAIALYNKVSDPDQKPEAHFQRADAELRSSNAEAADQPIVDGNFPTLDAPLTERVLGRVMTDGRRNRRWLRSLDRSTHRPATENGVRWDPHLAFTQIGWNILENAGRSEPLLIGVVAIRGRIVSKRPLVQVELKYKSKLVTTAKPTLVKHHARNRWLYIVNIWVDCNAMEPCRTKLTLTATDESGASISTTSGAVNIAHAPASFEVSASDAFIPSPVHVYEDLTAEILARPAKVRPAARSVFPGEIKRILAMRVDQLGDVSTTLPAMRRLRDLFPEAELSAMVSPALVDIVKATELCTEVITLSLTYDPVSERRYLDEKEQERVQQALKGDAFDIAIDLSPVHETRALLRMIDARYLVGFHPNEFHYLDFGITPFSHDKVNRREIMSHTSYVIMLVEAMFVAIRPVLPTVARQRDDTAFLNSMGLQAGQYVAIHSGARHKINRWPEGNFLELADRIASGLGYKIVYLSDTALSESVIASLKAKDQFLFPDKVSTDQLDALLARSRLMIGNDSGPKHLANVHGVDTVSIHINRLNWREWGQSSQGVIISKPVPCCGCGLNNEILCGKEVACVQSIKVDEVFDAVRQRLTAERH